MTLTQLIGHGGWIALIPLFICSILVVAVILERLWAFTRFSKIPKEAMRRVENLIVKGETYEALQLLDDYNSPYTRIARAGLVLKNPSDEEVTDILTLACETEISTASKPLPVLGTIGNIAPFIGLFGTIIGIMRAFQKIGTSGTAGYTTVSTEIAFALIATAIGLGIGVIAVIANNWCNAFIERYRLDLERFSTEWSYQLKDLRPVPGKPVEPLA